MTPVVRCLFTASLIVLVLLPYRAPIVRAGPADAPPGAPSGDPARPQDPRPTDEARDQALPVFKQGIAKFDAGYYHEAIKLFEKAYAIFPSAKIHTRIALAHKWLGNNLKALEHYEVFLKLVRGTPEGQQESALVGQVEAEVQTLLKLIAQVRLLAEAPSGAEIRINGQLAGTAPLDKLVRLDPGPVNVTAMATGYYPFKRDLQISGGQLATVRVSLIKIKPRVVHTIVKIQVPWYKRWWIWTTVGVVVAAGAAGASLGAYYSRPIRDLEGDRINHDSLGVRF